MPDKKPKPKPADDSREFETFMGAAAPELKHVRLTIEEVQEWLDASLSGEQIRSRLREKIDHTEAATPAQLDEQFTDSIYNDCRNVSLSMQLALDHLRDQSVNDQWSRANSCCEALAAAKVQIERAIQKLFEFCEARR